MHWTKGRVKPQRLGFSICLFSPFVSATGNQVAEVAVWRVDSLVLQRISSREFTWMSTSGALLLMKPIVKDDMLEFMCQNLLFGIVCCLVEMARQPSPDIDDELFNEIYGKEYTGPLQSKAETATPKGDTTKRPLSGSQSDEEDEPQDPNAVPTDFTSREAKVWEAKAKATERNWKKRKEEEMICKICRESGHFTQGCPSTLGANRKSADFFERVPARDKNVRALFSEKLINQIEKDVGCKIKMDEKFLIVSGKDRLVLTKGVDAVHKVIQDGKDRKRSPSSSNGNDSRSPDGSPKGSHLRRSEFQRSHSSPRNTSHLPSRGFNQERPADNHVRQESSRMSRGSTRARGKFKIYVFDYEVIFCVVLGQTDLLNTNSPSSLTYSSFHEAYANDGGKVHATRSKSPLRTAFGRDAYKSYDGHDHYTGMHDNNWDVARLRSDSHSECKVNFPSYSQSLEELEMEFKKELMELGKLHDQEEDDENYKHRQCVRQLREDHTKKLAIMRGMHSKQWEEFLQLDVRRQQQACQTVFNQPSLPEYDQSARNMQYVGSGLPMDSTNIYQYGGENFSAPRPHDAYSEFQHQRHEDFGNAYGRY
ncbi:zinc knuckle family protein [Musa troglodytarum]|uniref:Zinc knuckle family protein n=1 Tax=Musa troglodytarum TaxID=320322 RepID=A0A9E7GPJ4_9LILI|nr:zinc knuckle family protein [Musa troglodytarum]URE16094.1 zinc knuckle family protein [Musa troglodytarum]URE16097.1 zinc knuckle family protein [Musa troglodytarum]